jgi:hypothetical protein
MAGEKSSLKEDLQDAYGLSSHVKEAPNRPSCLVDYQPLKMSSFRIFCLSRGTILTNPVLIVEQVLLTIVFLGCALPVWWYFRTDTSADVSLSRFLRRQEGKMRAFAMIMTGLCTFLLSFYTSMCVGRWWTMRSVGIGQIKACTVDLRMLIYQCVTRQDDRVLDAVQRYGRASLQLIFMWRQDYTPDKMMQTLFDKKILDESECRLLKGKHCLHETIWAWQTAIVNKLYEQDLIKSDQLYAMLLEKCTEGRAAVQCIHTHLAVRIPMQYVHLLGFLVKMHNLILAIIMGLLFGAALRNGYTILCIQLFARTLILPFLFNAILLINCDLSDPFNGGEADFPGDVYVDTLEKDSKGIVDTAKNVPDWLRSAP